MSRLFMGVIEGVETSQISIDLVPRKLHFECDRPRKHLPLEWKGKKQHCQAKPQFVGCACTICLCNHPFLKVALSILAKEFQRARVLSFEAEAVYTYDNLYYLRKQ
jgi:hypothetical protein